MKSIISNYLINLSKYKKELKAMKNAFFQKDTIVLYEGQTPLSPILLVEGMVKIRRKNKVIATFLAGTIIAYSEFIHRSSVGYDVEITHSSKIVWLDNKFIKEIGLND